MPTGFRWLRPASRRLGLLAGGLGLSVALVSAASFALFTSQANPQTDHFQAGTVILTSSGGDNNCTTTGVALNNLEPGDSGSCTYTLTYQGSLNAWVDLSVAAQTYWLAPMTPTGSTSTLGGEALLADSHDANALQVSLSDSLGNLKDTALPLTCPNQDVDGQSPVSPVNCGQGTVLLKTGYVCTLTAAACNNTPTGSWGPGTTDVVTLNWHLPLAAGNPYQGSRAVITLQGLATQASNNPGGACVPGGPPIITSVGFTNVTQVGSDGMPGKNMGITVNGCNLGTEPTPMPNTDLTNAFSFSDQSEDVADGGWAAGCSSMPAGVTQYCTPHGGPNVVELNYQSWTNTQIFVNGFGHGYNQADYGYHGWIVEPGDHVTIVVMNPITSQYAIWHGTLPND